MSIASNSIQGLRPGRVYVPAGFTVHLREHVPVHVRLGSGADKILGLRHVDPINVQRYAVRRDHADAAGCEAGGQIGDDLRRRTEAGITSRHLVSMPSGRGSRDKICSILLLRANLGKMLGLSLRCMPL